LTVIALLLGMAACSKQESPPAETTPAATTTTAAKVITTAAKQETTTKAPEETTIENPFAEFMEISWLCGTYTSHLYEEGRWDELELEEMFNVDLKLWNILIHSGQMEQVEMMLAAGDVPDFGFYYKDGLYMYDNKLSRTVPEKFIRQYMPSLAKLYDENPLIWEFNKVEGREGEYYGLNMVLDTYIRSDNVPLWNLDWLENLGYVLDELEPCVYPNEGFHAKFNGSLYFSNTIFTVDEVTEIFRAFTEDDPDGNGVDDTAAYPESNTWYERTIYGMFGIDKNNNVFYLDELTGNVVPYYAHSYYRDYLVWLSQMLEKGYVKTLPGLDAAVDELASALSTGKFGFFNMRISRINTNYGNDVGTWPPLTILENIDPQARFVITPYMGENGGLIPYGYTPAQSNRAFIFGADVSDKKMARILQLYEYSCFGEDWMRYRFGIEGVHYKWSGEPYKSAMIFTPLDKIPKKYAGSVDMGQFGNTNFHIATGAVMNYEPTFLQWMEYYHSRYTYDEILLRPYKLYDYSTMPIEVYEEFQKLYQETGSQIFAVRNDFTNRVMKGGVANINAEWSQYLEQLYSAGLEDWIEIWNSDRIITYSDLVNPKS
jgi:hypothetical protein